VPTRTSSGLKANRSVEKAIALLRHAADGPSGSSVSSLARATGLSRPTASRLLATLERHGLLDRLPESGHYVLGYELARLGRSADPHRGLAARAQPVLQELADRSGETVTLSVPAPDRGLELIAQADAPRLIGLGRDWGHERFPLHASASGKLFLAELPPAELDRELARPLTRHTRATITAKGKLREELRRTRDRGYAVLEDELEEGLAALAVPVRDRAGSLMAIVTFTGPTSRLAGRPWEKTARLARAAASQLERLLCPDLEGPVLDAPARARERAGGQRRRPSPSG